MIQIQSRMGQSVEYIRFGVTLHRLFPHGGSGIFTRKCLKITIAELSEVILGPITM